MHRKYCITENQLDIDIIFTISRGMTKLMIVIEMEIMAIIVTSLVSIIEGGRTPLCASHSWSYI